ncbi:zinc-finger-containing protein [Burkholderia sp. Ac-20349]|uniref:zinc-finger-containing protein n=1 Tax=Burkholderia sp. Ac-20349 TaxID=2703893 RepID=UPI00197C46AD|nr:zinc-finger-containing protein [Burkholderia sp. Ac-20349]MBN3839335.1 hypothetical protein [Burkholderia sp. Ac-20349]
MNAIQQAFSRAGVAPRREPVSPWNPSRRATARVKNPLPEPTSCPYCGATVGIVNNKAIYGREYGEWPWAYACTEWRCRAYVGMHPFTNIPLGTLADKATREARKHAKALFVPLYESGRMTRTEAYAWLAGRLGIELEKCHFGWFSAEECACVEWIIKDKPAHDAIAQRHTSGDHGGAA